MIITIYLQNTILTRKKGEFTGDNAWLYDHIPNIFKEAELENYDYEIQLTSQVWDILHADDSVIVLILMEYW